MSDGGKIIPFPKKEKPQESPTQTILLISPGGMDQVQPGPKQKRLEDTMFYKISYGVTVCLFLGLLMLVTQWSLN